MVIHNEGYEEYRGETHSWNETYNVSDEQGKMTFKGDGTFSTKDGDSGNWFYKNGFLTLVHVDDEEDGETEVYKVLSLTSSEMTLELSKIDDAGELYNKFVLKKIS